MREKYLICSDVRCYDALITGILCSTPHVGDELSYVTLPQKRLIQTHQKIVKITASLVTGLDKVITLENGKKIFLIIVT